MKKIKLPRKRKKSFLKKYTYGDYISTIIINEILIETAIEDGKKITKKSRSFPIYKKGCLKSGKPILLYNW